MKKSIGTYRRSKKTDIARESSLITFCGIASLPNVIRAVVGMLMLTADKKRREQDTLFAKVLNLSP